MSERLSVILLLCFFPIACRAPLTTEGLPSVPRREFLKPAFDHRTWILTHRRADETRTLTEFLPAGQSALDWTESYGGTFQAEGHHAGSLQREYNNFIENLQETCGRIESTIISSTEVDLYYEWHLQNCSEHPSQVELGRFLRSTEGIYRLAYVKRIEFLTEAERENWLTLLRQAQLQKAK